jgi:hypothetical protein
MKNFKELSSEEKEELIKRVIDIVENTIKYAEQFKEIEKEYGKDIQSILYQFDNRIVDLVTRLDESLK